jgi:hypothetical protein
LFFVKFVLSRSRGACGCLFGGWGVAGVRPSVAGEVDDSGGLRTGLWRASRKSLEVAGRQRCEFSIGWDGGFDGIVGTLAPGWPAASRRVWE